MYAEGDSFSCAQFCRTDALSLRLSQYMGGWNSSVGSVMGSLSCVMQHHGFDPPLRRIYLLKGIFP